MLTVEQITQEALALPVEVRAILADRLMESINTAKTNSVQELWATEACRRRDDIRSGRVKTISGDEALKRVRQAFAQ
jgi:putative addiction module component (TIGR02574 family)